MASQTVPDSAPAPPTTSPFTVSLVPVPASLRRLEEPTPEGRTAVRIALDLLRVWIAACEALGEILVPGDGDVEALSWMMISIGEHLRQLESGGQDMPSRFFMAKSALRSLELYLTTVIQRTEETELPSEAMAGSAAYAYRLLVGLYGPKKAAS